MHGSNNCYSFSIIFYSIDYTIPTPCFIFFFCPGTVVAKLLLLAPVYLIAGLLVTLLTFRTFFSHTCCKLSGLAWESASMDSNPVTYISVYVGAR